MRIFIKRTLFFLTPVILLGLCCELLLRRIPNDYSYKNSYLSKTSASVKILFLGNSHVYYGINPAFVKEKGFNAGYFSQSLKYDLEILKKYQWDSLQYIAVSVDYSSLNYQMETSAESWRLKNYSIYYNIPTTNVISDHLEILSTNLHDIISRLNSYYIKGNSAIDCSVSGFGNLISATPQKDLISTGKESAKRHTQMNNENLSENTKILNSFVEFAKAKNIKVVFFTCPAYKSYVQNLDSNQLNQTTAIITRITNAAPNAFYFNFLEDKAFVAEDYYDADHLNSHGAKKLSIKIDSSIHSVIEKKAPGLTFLHNFIDLTSSLKE